MSMLNMVDIGDQYKKNYEIVGEDINNEIFSNKIYSANHSTKPQYIIGMRS